MPIDHFIYDFDGTLSDSYPIFFKILKEIIARHHGTYTCTDEALYRELKCMVAYAYKLVDWEEGMTLEQYRAEFAELQAKYTKDFLLYPHAKELLEAVVKSGKKNYLYTHSGKNVYAIMDHMGISQYFTDVLDGSHGFPLKPAPDALNSLIARHGLEPDRCVMIGDRPIDVGAGENAGMQSCLFDPDRFFEGTPATYHATELCELLSLI